MTNAEEVICLVVVNEILKLMNHYHMNDEQINFIIDWMHKTKQQAFQYFEENKNA